MILTEKLLPEVISYCKLHKIPIVNGNIPQIYIRDIEDYIEDRLKKERATTARLEENLQLKIDFSIKSIMGKLGDFKQESPIEEYLWDALEREELNHLVIRQFEIGKYRIDFAFPVAKLAVECDGAEYHRSNVQQLERDQKRDLYLARKGWQTLRIEGIAIRKDIKFCIHKIRERLKPFLATPMKEGR